MSWLTLKSFTTLSINFAARVIARVIAMAIARETLG
tara:strand:- start:99 stop:206 length:108 start_codon:yes stop_codon:yes gene_type:complete